MNHIVSLFITKAYGSTVWSQITPFGDSKPLINLGLGFEQLISTSLWAESTIRGFAQRFVQRLKEDGWWT